jgi:hypothetical protein
VKRGAKEAVRKALETAVGDARSRLEEVQLRLLAGTDAVSASFGRTTLSVQEASGREDALPDGKPGLRLKAVFQGTNEGPAPLSVTLAKATLVTAKGDFAMLVRGSRGEPFTRTYDPAMPKLFEYGALVPPRGGPGTPALIVFDLESGAEKRKVRTPVFRIERKE